MGEPAAAGRVVEMALSRTVREKLDPEWVRRLSFSPKMVALVAYLIEAPEPAAVTRPSISLLVLTSDGVVLAALDGDPLCSATLGTAEDLRRNWAAVLDAAGLTAKERAECALETDERGAIRLRGGGGDEETVLEHGLPFM